MTEPAEYQALLDAVTEAVLNAAVPLPAATRTELAIQVRRDLARKMAAETPKAA